MKCGRLIFLTLSDHKISRSWLDKTKWTKTEKQLFHLALLTIRHDEALFSLAQKCCLCIHPDLEVRQKTNPRRIQHAWMSQTKKKDYAKKQYYGNEPGNSRQASFWENQTPLDRIRHADERCHATRKKQ
ncbi:hypothetical protein T4C_8884 [Trichinella pseudospiralis]|uniref:Uncharacterized protein n=1 Tax=Trichinella pseudospiralis TaxID=6337 RepID=A0A0V1K8I6_TRIPS|nr:hypothetical protein T4C_8884 [Trichinella pseudospiralis]